MLEVRNAAGEPRPPLLDDMPERRRRKVEAIRPAADRECVMAGSVGVRAANIEAATCGPPGTRTDGHVLDRSCGTRDRAADDESEIEDRVDAATVDVRDDLVGFVEPPLVVPPLAEVARALRWTAEHRELDLHMRALRNCENVIAGVVGLRAAYELAAESASLLRTQVQVRDRRARRPAHVPADKDAERQGLIDPGRVADDVEHIARERMVKPPLRDVTAGAVLELELVVARRDRDRVVPKPVCVGRRDLGERTARDVCADDLHERAGERSAAAAFADVSADEEAPREDRVDPAAVRISDDLVCGVEAALVIPPLADVARARWRAAERTETDLHMRATRDGHAVVAELVGLRAANLLAAELGGQLRGDVQVRDRFADGTADVPADRDGRLHGLIDSQRVSGYVQHVGCGGRLVVPPTVGVTPGPVLELDLVVTGCDDGRVVAKGVGLRERNLGERTACDRRLHD